jgi:hypothetical protein
MQEYAQIYAHAMSAIGCPDAKYTRKSAMYRAIADGISEGDIMDVIGRLCAYIPGLRLANVEDIQECLGEGEPEGQQYAKCAVEKLLDFRHPFL